MFWSKRTETVYETLRLLFLLSPIVWNMCENLQYELVYFKELHNEQNTIDRQYTKRGQL